MAAQPSSTRAALILAGMFLTGSFAMFGIDLYYSEQGWTDILRGRSAGFACVVPALVLIVLLAWDARRRRTARPVPSQAPDHGQPDHTEPA